MGSSTVWLINSLIDVVSGLRKLGNWYVVEAAMHAFMHGKNPRIIYYSPDFIAYINSQLSSTFHLV